MKPKKDKLKIKPKKNKSRPIWDIIGIAEDVVGDYNKKLKIRQNKTNDAIRKSRNKK